MMVRSRESFLTVIFAAGTGAIFDGAAVVGAGVVAGEVAGPAVAGAVCAGRLVCAGRTAGFGPKNLAQRMITPKDNSEATRIRSSGVNLSFCPGALMNAPPSSKPSLSMNLLAFLPISPEPGRIQICARVDGSAAAASARARSHAPHQIVQWPRRRSANTSVQSGSFPQTELTNRLCRIAAQTVPRGQESRAPPLHVPQQTQQIRGQRRKLRARHRTLRVNDDVPSCGYLQPVAAHCLAQTPPDPIAHYCTAQGLLDAEAKTALRQFVGAKENCEVGTRTALSGAVDSIKLSAPHQPRLARKPILARTRTGRGRRVPRVIRG